jgi:hypothetical protein
METVETVILLAVGGLLAVLLRRSVWSPFGLLLVLFGMQAQRGTNVVALQYAAWAVLALSVFSVAAAIPRRVWADNRRVLVLAGSTMLGICLTYFAQSISRELVLVSVTLTAALTAWLVVTMIYRAFKS